MKRWFDIVASGWHGESHPSVFQTRERDDFYSIGTGIGHVAACKDKKKVGLTEWCFCGVSLGVFVAFHLVFLW